MNFNDWLRNGKTRFGGTPAPPEAPATPPNANAGNGAGQVPKVKHSDFNQWVRLPGARQQL